MRNTKQQSDGRFLSKLFYRVLPAQIFLLLLNGINNIVDGMVATNFLNPTAMSTIGLYAPFQMIWLAVSSTLMIGSQVLCGRYMGAGDLQRTRGVFSLSAPSKGQRNKPVETRLGKAITKPPKSTLCRQGTP